MGYMLLFIIILYLVVASAGFYLIYSLFTGRTHNIKTGIAHGLLGLFGISLLIIYTSFLQGDTPYISILLFVIAFFFGGGMFVMSIQQKKYPKIIAVIHMAIALTGIIFLITFSF